jgi:hypothetical protein
LVYYPGNQPLLVYPEINFNYEIFESIDGGDGIPTLEDIYGHIELHPFVERLRML